MVEFSTFRVSQRVGSTVLCLSKGLMDPPTQPTQIAKGILSIGFGARTSCLHVDKTWQLGSCHHHELTRIPRTRKTFTSEAFVHSAGHRGLDIGHPHRIIQSFSAPPTSVDPTFTDQCGDRVVTAEATSRFRVINVDKIQLSDLGDGLRSTGRGKG